MFLERELNIQFKASLLFVCFSTSETWLHMPRYRNRMFPQGLYVPRMVKPFGGRLYWEVTGVLCWRGAMARASSSFSLLSQVWQPHVRFYHGALLHSPGTEKPLDHGLETPKLRAKGDLFGLWVYYHSYSSVAAKNNRLTPEDGFLCTSSWTAVSADPRHFSRLRVNPDSCLTLLHDLGMSASALRISFLVFLSVNLHLPAPHW